MTLDSLALPHLDLLKIDVEDMEPEVLEGGRALIASQRPICWRNQASGSGSKPSGIERHSLGAVPDRR